MRRCVLEPFTIVATEKAPVFFYDVYRAFTHAEMNFVKLPAIFLEDAEPIVNFFAPLYYPGLPTRSSTEAGR